MPLWALNNVLLMEAYSHMYFADSVHKVEDSLIQILARDFDYSLKPWFSVLEFSS